ncbi:MAG: membrane protein insertion efficiency factor YidD [Dehalococcoidales bacterium]|nr:membrane protein insertion efficiency factor YidD [Dehalococcoidales bacterium]
MKRTLLGVIHLYQRFVSPLTPPSCRFYPTCSHYAYEAVDRYGAVQGGWMAVKRVVRCNPFHPGGYDPVP